MDDSLNKFDIISENNLSIFWNGINILDIFNSNQKIEIKKYYQFEHPLFYSDYLNKEKRLTLNNELLKKIADSEKINTEILLNNEHIILSTISKKISLDLNTRLCYTVRLSNCTDLELKNINIFLLNEILIDKTFLLSLHNICDLIKEENNFITYPLILMGFSKYKKEKSHYAQLTITNNFDTTKGIIHYVSLNTAIINTELILNGLKINYNIKELHDLILFLYSKK